MPRTSELGFEYEVEVYSPFRLLALDVGDRRIGVAVSDPTGSISAPIEVYRRQGLKADTDYVERLIGEYSAAAVLVGLPVNMNGTEGAQAEKTREFAAMLSAKGVDVRLWDERLSTVEATRRMVEQRRKRRGVRQRVDAEAAAVVLQTYLDHLRLEA